MMYRTDGVLVRVTTPLSPGEDIAAADQRIKDLMAATLPILPDYIPPKEAKN